MVDRVFEVKISVPATLSNELLDSLFDAVADAAFAWEPDERDEWDVVVSSRVAEYEHDDG